MNQSKDYLVFSLGILVILGLFLVILNSNNLTDHEKGIVVEEVETKNLDGSMEVHFLVRFSDGKVKEVDQLRSSSMFVHKGDRVKVVREGVRLEREE